MEKTVELTYIIKEKMSETRENSFDGGRGLFGSEAPRRCDNCEKFREEKGLGDFICRHMRGYKEAPLHIRRCSDCELWRSEKGITSNFWCKHNKFYKKSGIRAKDGSVLGMSINYFLINIPK